MIEIVKTLTLKEPVEWGKGNTITELQFEKPRGRHFRNMEVRQDPLTGEAILRMGMLMDVAAALCNVPSGVIDELCLEDTAAVWATVQGFMPAGLRIG